MFNEGAEALLTTTNGVLEALNVYAQYGYTIGSTTEILAEAADASVTGAPVTDGLSGDTDFPHGNLKPIATIGERSVCLESLGEVLTGPPDGIGSYLFDDDTIRIVYQSEAYGPLAFLENGAGETWPYVVNDGVLMGGSHVHYIDYDRELMSIFMDDDQDFPASDMVTGAGGMITTVYNLKGDLVAPRNRSGATEFGAHYGNCDADGQFNALHEPKQSDW